MVSMVSMGGMVRIAVMIAACASCSRSSSDAPPSAAAATPSAAQKRKPSTRSTSTAAPTLAASADDGDAIARMASLRDEMCECTDRRCADGVSEAMARWGKELAATPASQAISEAAAGRMAALAEEMTTCMTKAMTAGTAAPAATAPAAAGEALARMASFRDDMCACAETRCTDRVTEAMTQWGKEMGAKLANVPASMSEAENARLAEITEQMTACMTKALAAGSQ